MKHLNIVLHLYTAQSKSLLKANGLDEELVNHHQHVDNAKILGILSQADILFLPLAFNSPIPEVIKTSAPGKIGEYLQAGKPIVVHAPSDSFVSWYFKKNHCGVVVDKNDPHCLMEELDKLVADPSRQSEIGKRAMKVAARDFDEDRARESFKEMLSFVVARKSVTCECT